MTEQPTPQPKRCTVCNCVIPDLGDVPTGDLCDRCKDNPARQEWIKKIKVVGKDQLPRIYPSYAVFCDNFDEQIGFKPARVAQWLAREEHFKTDSKTGILYYGNVNTGRWTPNGETELEKITATIMGEENRSIHYTNILHSLKGLTYCDIEFSKKLACDNGILDLETMELKTATLEEMTVYSVATPYPDNPDVKSEYWLEFLKQVVAPEDILALQEWSGYLLLTDYRFHKLMWMHGEGRNGKGVWQRTMEDILGSDMVSGVSLEEFDGNHRFAMRQLHGKLFNPCSEPTTNRILQTALLKKATGQDTISAECKGKDKRIDFRNTSKITVIANKFPKVKDSTTAFRERRLFIKFPYEFTGKNCIVNLERVWLDDPLQRMGVFNWMLEGLRKLLSQGYFSESKSQEETEIAFERASDTISSFLKEMAVYDKPLVTLRSYAYDTYKEYCEAFGLDQENEKKFTQRLKETHGITPGRIGNDRAWKGVAFRDINEDGEIVETEESRTARTQRTHVTLPDICDLLNKSESSTPVRPVRGVRENSEFPSFDDKCEPMEES